MTKIAIKLTNIDAQIARLILQQPPSQDQEFMLTRLAYLSGYETFCEDCLQKRVISAAECSADLGGTGELILASDIGLDGWTNNIAINEGDENSVVVVLEPIEEPSED